MENVPVVRVLTEEEAALLERLPVAVNFGPGGVPVFDVAGAVRPEACAHSGQAYSSDFEARCACCGAALFLPPSILAGLPADTIDGMHAEWKRGGCAPWLNGHWSIVPEYWLLFDVPGFAACGGLAVLRRRADSFSGYAELGGAS